LNFLSGSPRDKLEQLLKKRGFQILGKSQKGTVLITLNGQEHLGSLTADYTARKDGKEYVVVTGEGDPTEPALRRELIEYDRFFGLHGILLVDPRAETIREIRLKFPREKGLDFYFQFVIALFIIAGVIGIIWLMVYLRLI
jgi:hypothetical protein